VLHAFGEQKGRLPKGDDKKDSLGLSQVI